VARRQSFRTRVSRAFMQLSAERRHESGALLTVAGPHGYALPGGCVLGIEHLRDWQGEAPLDVLPLLGIEAAALSTEQQRVALLDAGERHLPLLVRGALALIHPGPGELLPLPRAMQSLAPLVTHIAVVDGKPSFFVRSPTRLAHAQAATSPVLPLASR
jgi:hypothetical protein